MKKKSHIFLIIIGLNCLAFVFLSIFIRSYHTRLSYEYADRKNQYARLKRLKQQILVALEQEKSPKKLMARARDEFNMKPLQVLTNGTEG